MALDVVQLTRELVAIDSVSARSDEAVATLLEDLLRGRGFAVERLEYHDPDGVLKVSIVGRKGRGTGGLAFLSHFDTVPGTGWDRDPWEPVVEDGRLIGLGSCDMKGPLAATVVAADGFDADALARPVLIVTTADEEISAGGRGRSSPSRGSSTRPGRPTASSPSRPGSSRSTPTRGAARSA